MESTKEEKLISIARMYYSRQDVQKAIFEFCKNRETIARHFDIFSKRPDFLSYPSDIMQHVKNGFTSFHCSQEIWKEPLELSTEMEKEKIDNLRKGWDLIIDIDSRYLDYSKIAAELIVRALEFHNVKNIGIKFSGGKGVHIIVPWKAFPRELLGEEARKMFPEWPRVITKYLNELIKPKLIERLTELTTKEKYVKDFEASKEVMPDLVLVSSRHLFRCPYSLHEKGMVSVVIDKNEIRNFEPKLADPLRVKIKNFYPEAKENEARELLISALDWNKERDKRKKQETKKEYEEIAIDKSHIVYPPCINKILEGIEDGKKRALFILINYFRSLNFSFEEIEKKIEDWNNKNKKQLKEGYTKSQIEWYKRQRKMLPPNCDKDYYKAINVCIPESLCEKIKNPVNYTIRKMRRK